MPKQYLPLLGQPIAMYSLQTLCGMPEVGELVIVCDPSYQASSLCALQQGCTVWVHSMNKLAYHTCDIVSQHGLQSRGKLQRHMQLRLHRKFSRNSTTGCQRSHN